MKTWLTDAVDTVHRLALVRDVLRLLSGRAAELSGMDVVKRRATAALPIDVRPIDLARDIDRYAQRYSALARGSVKAGPEVSSATADRLQFVAGALGGVDGDNPDLARELVSAARRLVDRFEAIVHPGRDSYVMAAPCPVERCRALRLWVDRTTWTVQCGVCGTRWGPADLERLAVRQPTRRASVDQSDWTARIYFLEGS